MLQMSTFMNVIHTIPTSAFAPHYAKMSASLVHTGAAQQVVTSGTPPPPPPPRSLRYGTIVSFCLMNPHEISHVAQGTEVGLCSYVGHCQ